MELVKLACFLILSNFFMGTSCPSNEEPEDQTRQKTKTSYEMQELKESNNSVIKGFMSKSNDHKFIYVTSSDNANLYAVEVATKQFTKLKINAKPANPEVVGKADLSAANNVDYLYPTDNGIMATVKNANTVGVAQFAGNTPMPEHTWKLTQGDTDFSAATDTANDSYKGFMAYKKDGANITNAPYILSENKKGFFTTANTAGAATKLINISTRATTDLIFAETNFVADKTSGVAYVIDKSGIANIAAANINVVGQNITLANNFTSFNLKQADGNAGTDEQDNISFVNILANKIYVAFTASSANNGGVAVIELNANGELGTIHAPNYSWSNKSIINLTHNDTDMYAVMADNIVKVNPDASMDSDLTEWLSVKGSDDRKVLQGNILHAEITADELFIATDLGLFNTSKKTLTKTKIK